MFGKYDVYTTTQSLYCYKDSSVLKNKLGITDGTLLKQAEDEITSGRLLTLNRNPIKGNFSSTHLANIHKYIFGDVYNFAGKIRKEDIFKGETRFYPHYRIRQELNKLLAKLKEDKFLIGLLRDNFIERFAYYMTELNMIHPFREGNGRSIREFIRLLAERNGYFLDWSKAGKEELFDATIESEIDTTRLQKCLNKTLEIS